uniref:RETREG1-3/ARL6IP-like N-terminal reticulon-homology domain-containing protein n=1 Tax=Clastoptera arizonana TaxID=38151 RepID=A0A1B6DQP4_9HEMI
MSFKNVLNRLKFWKRSQNEPIDQMQSEEERIANSLRCYETYVFRAQKILVWENPISSILSVILVNFLFWLLLKLEWRIYGIVCSAVLVLTVQAAWQQHIWPEISVAPVVKPEGGDLLPAHPSVLEVSRFVTSLKNHFKNYFNWLKALRSDQPTMFCCLLSILFGSLMLLGEFIPGATLLYVIIMLIMIVPGIVKHCLSAETKEKIYRNWHQTHLILLGFVSGDESDDDEYLPPASSEVMKVLEMASDGTNDMQKSEDSCTTRGSSVERWFGLTSLPPHDEASLDSLAELSDLPSIDPRVDDSDSASEDAKQIQFKSGHFNGDTSSSDDEEKAFTKDLSFSEIDHRKQETATTLASMFTQAVANNLMGTVGKGLLANVMGLTATTESTPATTPSSRLDSDSDLDNDFEIIDKDELDGTQS